MRLFFDANVLFAAALTDGAVRRLLHLALELGHELAVDELVVHEASRNLSLKTRLATTAALDDLLKRVSIVAGSSAGTELAELVALPAKDLPVLAAAIRSGSTILVTGDRRHFGPLFGRTIRGVWIASPRLAAERLLEK